MKSKTKILLLLLIILPIFFLTGCEKGTDFSLYAMLNNQAKDPYYIWIGESSKPQPSDLVAPGQFRTINLGLSGREGDGKQYFDDTIRMHVSKDGKTQLSEKYQQLNNSYVPGKTMYVRWSGSDFTIDY
jgi:hypothetical protein